MALAAPAAADFAGQDNEAVRPASKQFRVAALFPLARPDKGNAVLISSARDGPAAARQRGHEGGIAAKGMAERRHTVEDEVEAPAVGRWDASSGCGG